MINIPFIVRIFGILLALLFPALPWDAVAANWLAPGFADAPPMGPQKAAGIVIWSHGRSLTREDSTAATPAYLRAFIAAGWDVLRFNRLRTEDGLIDSTHDLDHRVTALAQQGYHRIVLAGQSYGGFLALGAARDNRAVDAVIATAPAAYGSYYDSYESWHENADALYRILAQITHARVLIALFHGDDYDPGGRGATARSILAGHGIETLVIDQPQDLIGHLAANSSVFARRYGACVLAFAAAATPPRVCPSTGELSALP